MRHEIMVAVYTDKESNFWANSLLYTYCVGNAATDPCWFAVPPGGLAAVGPARSGSGRIPPAWENGRAPSQAGVPLPPPPRSACRRGGLLAQSIASVTTKR